MAGKKLARLGPGAALGVALIPAYVFIIRPRFVRWGAEPDEASTSLPGDDLVPKPRMESTRGITVNAPASRIWPWLVQIGQGRGGLYSYDWLENLIGCDIHSLDHIEPELQHLAPGDEIRMGREGYPFYRVASVEPERALVMQAGDPRTKEPASGSWTFVLQERPDGTTRLISRQRVDYVPGVATFLLWRVFTEPLSFVMEQRMLRTLKERAEGAS